MEAGFIRKVLRERRCGFITHAGGDNLFFLASVLAGIEWDDVQPGLRVYFDAVDLPEGPRAIEVLPSHLFDGRA